MNPCPCGYYNHPEKECVCSPGIIQRYLNKISGPLLDRIDIHIEVVPVSYNKLSDPAPGEPSEKIRERVIIARNTQSDRFLENENTYCNAQMSSRLIREHCTIDTAGKALLKKAMEKLGLSARAYDRILRVARTIADLEQEANIQSYHLAEAIQYRSLDKNNWGN